MTLKESGKFVCPNYIYDDVGHSTGMNSGSVCGLNLPSESTLNPKCADGNVRKCEFAGDERVREIQKAFRVLKSEIHFRSGSWYDLLEKEGFKAPFITELESNLCQYQKEKYQISNNFYNPKYKELLEIYELGKSDKPVKGFGKRSLLALEIILRHEDLID